MPPTPKSNVLGVLSLIFWSLILVVSLKYVVFIMRADNKGEGGIMALMALAHAQRRRGEPRAALVDGHAWPVRRVAVLRRRRHHAGDFGAFGASKASKVAAPALDAWIVPITARDPAAACSRSSATAPARVGALFGPVMLIWFVVIARARRRT